MFYPVPCKLYISSYSIYPTCQIFDTDNQSFQKAQDILCSKWKAGIPWLALSSENQPKLISISRAEINPGFSPDPLDMGGFVPPYGGTSAGGQSINGGTHEGDIHIMGGPNFDRLYHKLKVLLLLLLLLLCYWSYCGDLIVVALIFQLRQ